MNKFFTFLALLIVSIIGVIVSIVCLMFIELSSSADTAMTFVLLVFIAAAIAFAVFTARSVSGYKADKALRQRVARDMLELTIKKEKQAKGEFYLTSSEKEKLNELVRTETVSEGTKCPVCDSRIIVKDTINKTRYETQLVDVPGVYTATGIGMVTQAKTEKQVPIDYKINVYACPKCMYSWHCDVQHTYYKVSDKDGYGYNSFKTEMHTSVNSDVDWGNLKNYI